MMGGERSSRFAHRQPLATATGALPEPDALCLRLLDDPLLVLVKQTRRCTQLGAAAWGYYLDVCSDSGSVPRRRVVDHRRLPVQPAVLAKGMNCRSWPQISGRRRYPEVAWPDRCVYPGALRGTASGCRRCRCRRSCYLRRQRRRIPGPSGCSSTTEKSSGTFRFIVERTELRRGRCWPAGIVSSRYRGELDLLQAAQGCRCGACTRLGGGSNSKSDPRVEGNRRARNIGSFRVGSELLTADVAGPLRRPPCCARCL